ncbi:hypothetical protein HO133_006598 [Letharia lupina]|uniref:Uncharacterized protein n=1 Tax=Letharia lupina TaxID=560253 RepID=A0A8H6C6W3_9LECA|nr:uncharacterized protein HO133_006598 [Letharia lupina]KAF6217771.1 hypothetical protein HO133_006598 [Letharia lupina]
MSPPFAEAHIRLTRYTHGISTMLFDFLNNDILTLDLDRMAPNLWLMDTPSGSHISPLHNQKIKSRKIVITEDPGLHLVSSDNRVFIKPFPPYLQFLYLLGKILDRAEFNILPVHIPTSQDIRIGSITTLELR